MAMIATPHPHVDNLDGNGIEDTIRIMEEKLYLFKIYDDIKWFLELNPLIVPILFEAYVHIEDVFPFSQKLLEVVSDPEIAECYQLVLFISTKLPVDEAYDRLKSFDKKWWLSTKRKTNGLLNITLDFS